MNNAIERRINTMLKQANEMLSETGYQLSYTFDTSASCMQRAIERIDLTQPILFPICLNNGFYNGERIRLMMRYLPFFCQRAVIFFTDGPAKSNYLALGKTKEEATRIAHLQRNRLHNHCIAGLEYAKHNSFSPQFDNWQNTYSDPDYQEAYEYIKSLFTKNPSLREDIEQDTFRVLTRLTRTEVTKDKIQLATDYVLQELAYILSVPVRWGFEEIIYTYYTRWSVLEKLLDGQYDGLTKQNIAYLVLTLQGREK